MICMGGEIKVKGPDVLKRLAEKGQVVFDINGVEFILTVADGIKEEMEFDPWFALSDAGKLTIGPEENELEFYPNFVSVLIQENGKRSCALQVSYSQAKAITEFLNNYVAAYEAVMRMQETKTATA